MKIRYVPPLAFALVTAAVIHAPAHAQFGRFKPRVTVDVPTPKDVVDEEKKRLQNAAENEVDALRADAEAEIVARQDAVLGNIDDAFEEGERARQNAQTEVDRRTRLPEANVNLNPFGRRK